MQLKQFEDKNLSHYSYAVLSECEKQIVLVDPARNVQQYLDFAKDKEATIIGVIETHPHADFVSSHLELHETTGATIYTSKLVDAVYPHKTFDDGDIITFGKIKLSALNTPGHSPDSISIVLEHDGRQKAVFTGDTLFIGDCGRPDLRSGNGDVKEAANQLARQMYHSLRDKLMVLEDETIVYPAHGAGTLCGKNLSKESTSTIGKEKETNWSLQEVDEEEFVKNLLQDQPFVPAYFPYDVELNKKGAPHMKESVAAVKKGVASNLNKDLWIVDVRNEDNFKEGHLPHSINIQEDGKFETWLGSIIKPEEQFYIAAKDEEQLQRVLIRVAAIGYETAVAEALIVNNGGLKEAELDVDLFKNRTSDYTIIDVRNKAEVEDGKIFENSVSIPLAEVRDRVEEIPTNKPIVVHCAGGYRSAAGSSIIKSALDGKVKVFDLSEAIKQFQ
jgi:glyoxylase-like metal-dependent hydrolase (beta-lactamase superfamily II)/rhodanese-related sulfurtransferase